jgi:hypothetical protein
MPIAKDIAEKLLVSIVVTWFMCKSPVFD